jgi:hypothetical protein
MQNDIALFPGHRQRSRGSTNSLLPEGLSTKYSTAKLQTRLQNHYGDTIVIESQKGQGQSNIVFSSSISVADAIRAAQ